jgi:hypothetical protein
MRKVYTITATNGKEMVMKLMNCSDLENDLSVVKDFVDAFYPEAVIDVKVDYKDKSLYLIHSNDSIYNGETREGRNFLRSFHKAIMRHRIKVVR